MYQGRVTQFDVNRKDVSTDSNNVQIKGKHVSKCNSVRGFGNSIKRPYVPVLCISGNIRDATKRPMFSRIITISEKDNNKNRQRNDFV